MWATIKRWIFGPPLEEIIFSSQGHGLLADLDKAIEDIAARAMTRHADVTARIAELESELTALRAVQSRASSVASTPQAAGSSA